MCTGGFRGAWVSSPEATRRAENKPDPAASRAAAGVSRRVSSVRGGHDGSDLTGIFSDFLFREGLHYRSGQSSSPEAYDFHCIGQQATLWSAKGKQDRYKHHDDGDAN